MWHFLYFFPLPHQQGSFRPSLGISRGAEVIPINFVKKPISLPPVQDWSDEVLSKRCLYLPHAGGICQCVSWLEAGKDGGPLAEESPYESVSRRDR